MFHLVDDERLEALRVQQRLGLLIQECLVGRAAALGDKEKLIGGALRGVEIDLRRKVCARVDLRVHVERDHLRITEVFLGVGLVDPLAQVFGVVGARPDLLAFLGDDRGRAGVLTEGEDALRGDLGVAQHREGDVAVVRRRAGVVEDGGDLLEVFCPQQERTIAQGLGRQVGQCLGVDLEDLPAGQHRRGEIVRGQQAIGSFVRAERERFLVAKGRDRHGAATCRLAANDLGENTGGERNEP